MRKNGITLRNWSNSIQVINKYIPSILQNLPFSHQIGPRKTASDPFISFANNAIKSRNSSCLSLN